MQEDAGGGGGGGVPVRRLRGGVFFFSCNMATCSVSSVSRGNVIFEILNITGNNNLHGGGGAEILKALH